MPRQDYIAMLLLYVQRLHGIVIHTYPARDGDYNHQIQRIEQFLPTPVTDGDVTQLHIESGLYINRLQWHYFRDEWSRMAALVWEWTLLIIDEKGK